jgi:uncharacterized linocin/CFP29 family protein
VDGAVVLSPRGDDYDLSCGQDFAIGYTGHGSTSVELYLEESMGFRVRRDETAVSLVYAS